MQAGISRSWLRRPPARYKRPAGCERDHAR